MGWEALALVAALVHAVNRIYTRLSPPPSSLFQLGHGGTPAAGSTASSARCSKQRKLQRPGTAIEGRILTQQTQQNKEQAQSAQTTVDRHAQIMHRTPHRTPQTHQDFL